MALPGFEIFRSECVGVGYWSHFLLGALVALLYTGLWRKTSFLVSAVLLGYQVADYFLGRETFVSDEFGFFRDVGEYFLGYIICMAGAMVRR